MILTAGAAYAIPASGAGSFFQVQYRCLYREIWYDAGPPLENQAQAATWAQQVKSYRQGAPVRILEETTGATYPV